MPVPIPFSSANVEVFFELAAVPVVCNVQYPTLEAALQVATGTIRLGYFPEMGHIYNLAFTEALIDYDQSYENSLHFSPRFQRYVTALITDLVDRYHIYNQTVIDIGCGKGDFLKLIVAAGGNRGVGFDKSYVPAAAEPPNLTFIQDFYTAEYAAQYSPDVIVCRHVLEHLSDPATFLRQLRSWLGDNTQSLIFFEVPNALYTLRDLGIWDIIYEHCSYFTPPSLARLFADCGFDVQRVSERYQGQFLTIEATPSRQSPAKLPRIDISLSEIQALVNSFAKSYQLKAHKWHTALEHLAQAKQKVVIWGSGSKGVTFLNALATRNKIAYAVDINPRKQGKYIGGTGQKIVPPAFLKDYQPHVVLIMNPAYLDEIRETVANLDIYPHLWLV